MAYFDSETKSPRYSQHVLYWWSKLDGTIIIVSKRKILPLLLHGAYDGKEIFVYKNRLSPLTYKFFNVLHMQNVS